MKFYDSHFTKLEKRKFLRRIEAILDRGDFINGREVHELEAALSKSLKQPFLSCNSGTDALILGLKALGVSAGDEVILPAFTFFSPLEAIHHVGATPVFADIELSTFNLDPEDVARRITSRTRAVIAVHLFGLSTDLARLKALCRRRGLFLVEDCAQAQGALFREKPVGTWGDLGCFSFFPTKNLGGFGDGGGIVSPHRRVREAFKRLRNHGQAEKYNSVEMGYNSRLDTLHAALLIERLPRMKGELAARRRRALAWIKRLRKHSQILQLPDNPGHTYNQFSILVRNRAAFIKELDAEGIPHMIYYPRALYRQRAYTEHYGAIPPLKNTEFAVRHVVSLPILN